MRQTMLALLLATAVSAAEIPTGTHALLTGEVATDLNRLLDLYGFSSANELIEQKLRGESAELPVEMAEKWRKHIGRAFEVLDGALQRSALPEEPRAQVIGRFAGQQFSGFKNALAELAVAKLTPIAAQMRRLLADPAEIDRILADGAARASAIAEPILADVKRLVGFL